MTNCTDMCGNALTDLICILLFWLILMKGTKPITAECEIPVLFYVRYLFHLSLIADPNQNPSGMCYHYEAIRNNEPDSNFLGMSTNISQTICGFPQSV
jgi:hypothetical protein